MAEDDESEDKDESSDSDESVYEAMRRLRNPLEVMLANAEHARNVFMCYVAQGFPENQALYLTSWQLFGVKIGI